MTVIDRTTDPAPQEGHAYAALEVEFARMADIGQALGVLGWDRAVMMPKGAARDRGDQVATLSGLAHAMLTTPAMADRLDEAEANADQLSPMARANLREMRRAHRHATALPQALVEAMSRATTKSEMVWREARAKADFAMMRPELEAVLTLTIEKAQAKAAAFGCDPYTALLDSYDPGMTPAVIDDLFDDLTDFLPGFLGQVQERQAQQQPPTLPRGPYPIPAQRDLGLALMTAAGFDFDRGRLDVSTHPFCGGGGPNDIRITTRYDEADFSSALMGVMHETGHALYEAGLPDDWRRQPVGTARGMTMHESQSLLIEMQACRSAGFMQFLAPQLAANFGASADGWTPDALHYHYTRVAPGFIRVDADEVTYPAHVILRYRLERAMIAGDLTIADLPGAWNAGLHELLGITPPDDGVGCLQDIHWPDGAFGYFPTYTLGALTAAQLFAAIRRDLPHVEQDLGRGDFTALLTWLRKHIHGRGSVTDTMTIIADATGEALSTSAFKQHLKTRYLS
ncbi:MAG: carboxypeptidase M32 [Pseudomonadota bacterium]